MGRTRVVTLIVLTALLVSGTRVERAEQSVIAASPVAASAPTEFDENPADALSRAGEHRVIAIRNPADRKTP